MIAEQLQLFDFAPVLNTEPFVWIHPKNDPKIKRHIPVEYPFHAGLITPTDKLRASFWTFAEAKEWASIRIEQSAATDPLKLIIWRSNVEVWQYPPRDFKGRWMMV